MTEQYAQVNINRPRPARRVDQADIIAPATTVPIGTDDRFTFLADDGATGAYTVELPNVQEVDGLILFFKHDPASGVVITIAPIAGQTIEGGIIPSAASESIILAADPVDNSSGTPVLPTNWSLIKVGAP